MMCFPYSWIMEVHLAPELCSGAPCVSLGCCGSQCKPQADAWGSIANNRVAALVAEIGCALAE